MNVDDRPPVQVTIIGSGFAGLAMAIQLTRHGTTDFVVLERAADVGGAWRDNTYPGCACDVPSTLYSFSFATNPDWTASFSPQREIHHYLRDCAPLRAAPSPSAASRGTPGPLGRRLRALVDQDLPRPVHRNRAGVGHRPAQRTSDASAARTRALHRNGLAHLTLGSLAWPCWDEGRGDRYRCLCGPTDPRDR